MSWWPRWQRVALASRCADIEWLRDRKFRADELKKMLELGLK